MERNRRRWWTRLVTVAAVMIVLAATISVSFKLAVDAVPGYRAELEGLVAESVGHPARIGAMALTWRHLKPTLELRDVALLDSASGKPLLEAARLNLGVGLWRLLRGSLSLSRVEAVGIQLEADVDADGQWSLRGFDSVTATSRDTSSLLADLKRFDSLRVLDSELRLHDVRLPAQADDAPLRFRLRSAAIRQTAGRYELNATLEPPSTLAQRLSLHAALAGDPERPASWKGDWQLSVEQLAGWPWLASVLAPGVELAFAHSELKLEGRIEKGRIAKARLDLQVGSLIARQAGEVRAELTALQLRAHATPLDDAAWRVDVDQLALSGPRGAWNAGALSMQRSANADGGGLRLDVAQLRLDDWFPWFALSRALPASAARLRDLHGEVEALALQLLPAQGEAAQQVEIKARLHGVGLSGEAGQPGFSTLEGQLEGSLDGGHIVLDGSPLLLHLPDDFEQDVAIQSLRGELAWQHAGADWLLKAPGLDLRLLGTEADGDAALKLFGDPAVAPLLQVHLRLRALDAAALKPLMPTNWGPHTRAWLEHALTRAKVTQGELKIDAPMTPRNAEGHMTMPWRLDLDVADAELDYLPGWPVARELNAALHFHDAGLDISADAGELGGNRISRFKASIADFHDADLVLDASVAGDGSNFYRVLRESPLQPRFANLLKITEASGPMAVEVHLQVPLHVEGAAVLASGTVRFDDAELAIHGVDQPLRELNGQLAFGPGGIAAEALVGTLYDSRISARIRPEPEAQEGVLVGEFAFAPAAVGGIEEAFVPSWLRTGLSGQSTMRLRLPFSGPDSGKLALLSDLRGVVSTLPPPLAKQLDDSLALKIGIGGDAKVPLRVQVEVGEQLSAGLRFAEVEGATKTQGVEVRIGTGPAPRAEADGLVVIGAPGELDLASWGALLGAVQNGSSALPFTRVDLHPEHLVYRSLALGATHLLATPAANKAINVLVEGAAEGRIDWQPAQGGLVYARLQRAAFEPLPPLPGGVPEPSKTSPFDPATAPLLDIECASLSLGEVDLGRLTVLTARVEDGQRIETLKLGDGKLRVDAQGNWLRRDRVAGESGSSADLSFDIDSSAIGKVLEVFGYAPNLRAEDAHFSGHVRWPRVPEGLELAQAEGMVELDVKRGTLKAIEPGAGRVLGLINLYALPRRLLFDFRDVVSEGLAFDTIKGDFTLAAGDAETKDLQIAGPQAKIKLEGRIGLAARDYDQRVTVTPDISTGVTLGATLIGGPIGGGIALVAQSLFGKPFNRLARFSYRVTGSWDNPEVIKGAEAAVPAPQPAAAGATNG